MPRILIVEDEPDIVLSLQEDLGRQGYETAVASDGENVWVGTESGLARWRPATGEWRSYGPQDGLGGVPVLHLLAESDAVWASSPAGVTRFAWREAGP